MEYHDAKIMIFAKAPIAGTVKTRLIPDIGQQAATDLHRELLVRQLELISQSQLCEVELWVGSDIDHPFFRECQRDFSFTLHQQVGDGLGERMHHALSQQKPSCAALLIGCDVPVFTIDYLRRAIDRLHHGDEWVLGPAEDGGYVLVGCRQSDWQFFAGIEWGSDKVLSQTLENAEKIGCQPYLMEPLWDLDDIADLRRWRAMSK